jgi:hypothetical protein
MAIETPKKCRWFSPSINLHISFGDIFQPATLPEALSMASLWPRLFVTEVGRIPQRFQSSLQPKALVLVITEKGTPCSSTSWKNMYTCERSSNITNIYHTSI